MNDEEQDVYEFGEFRLNALERTLFHNGEPVPLTNKAFEVLLILVQRSGHLVRKSELINVVWKDSFVEEGNLPVTISVLRKILGEDTKEPIYIATVVKQGYRFIAEVQQITNHKDESASDSRVNAKSTRDQPFYRQRSVSFIFRIATVLLIGAGFMSLIIIHGDFHAAKPGIRSLAILPFQTASSDSSLAHLALGIADDLAMRLGRSAQIAVRPPDSEMKYANGWADPLAMAREQQADSVLTGSMVASHGRIRVTAELIRVNNGVVLWRGTFEQPSGQVIDLERQIEDATSRFLFSDRAPEVLAKRETQNPEAYRLYVEGRYFWNKRTKDGLQQSIKCFQQAIIRDSGYAEAYAGLADSYVLLASYGVEPAQEAYPNAKAAALKAIQLDSSSAEAYASLGMVSFKYEWNWADSKAEFRRAIALNPDYATAHTWYALVLAATGEYQQAIVQAQRGVDLDPVSLIVNTHLGAIYFLSQQYGKAIAVYRHVIDLDPTFSRVHKRLGVAYAAEGDYRDAIVEFERARTTGGPDLYLEGDLGYAEALNGDAPAARRLLNAFLIERSRGVYVPTFSIALIYIGLRERGPSLQWLVKSYRERSPSMVYSNVEPLLSPVRSSPHFSELMARMGFVQTLGHPELAQSYFGWSSPPILASNAR